MRAETTGRIGKSIKENFIVQDKLKVASQFWDPVTVFIVVRNTQGIEKKIDRFVPRVSQASAVRAQLCQLWCSCSENKIGGLQRRRESRVHVLDKKKQFTTHVQRKFRTNLGIKTS